MRNRPAPRHKPDIELVGGPFCGAHIRATIEELKPGGTINTPCKQRDSHQGWSHLDAVYEIHDDSKGVFLKYAPTEF